MSGTRAQLRAYESRAQVEGFNPDIDAGSPFTDTVAAAFAQDRREALSSSSNRAFSTKNEERAAVIGELGGNEQMALNLAWYGREVMAQLREDELQGRLESNPLYRADRTLRDAYQQQRQFEQAFPGKVLDDQALLEQFAGEAAALRADENYILSRGSGFAQFIGSGAAVMTDPLVLATLPFGASGGVGRTVLSSALRTAAVEGALATATEIPIQAQVLQFKRSIESPWTWKNSAMNILAAGIGGAVIGGAIGGGVQGGRQLLERYRSARASGEVQPTADMEAAAEALEETIRLHEENPLDVDGGAVESVHEAAIDLARAQHEQGLPIDVSEQVAGLEPTQPADVAMRRMDDPAEFESIDPTEVQVDAETFQFKAGSDAAGVTEALQGVDRFDRTLAGVALIWERADGSRFIADGHQRLALAQRALAGGQDPAEVRLNGFVLREADGVTAADARQLAAIKNMAEGSGTAIDAAKILREVGPSGERMLPPLPPRSALVRQARGLAQLDDEQFMAVVNGVIDARFGAIIGGATEDSKLQQAMVEVIRRTSPANETQARAIVEQVKQQGVVTRTTEDLFGEQSISESLYLERAQVLDAALRKAREDKTVFGRLLSESSRIERVGSNRLDRAANQQRAQEATHAATQITARANVKGELSDALTEAARQVKAGAKPGAVAADFLKAARREILTEHRRRRQAGRDRPGHDAAGAGPENLVPEPGRIVRVPPELKPQALEAIKSGQRGQSVEALFASAAAHQRELRALADEIAEEIGEDVVLSDPGIKSRGRVEEKIASKGYSDAGDITDVIRLGFMVRTPDQAAMIIDRLGSRFGVLDEGVSVTGMGYLDHKALVRFSDGRVGEVQLWDPEMAKAKFGRGEDLYHEIRQYTADEISADPALYARHAAAQEESRALYASALAKASPEWRRVALMMLPDDMRARVQALVDEGVGSGGEFGNVSRNAARDSSLPDSSTSTGTTRDQASDSRGTNQASTREASASSRTSAARPSQLKNRSAIDATPRSIVRKVDDKHSAAPAATKTGTVDDLEYDTVMRQFDALADDLGEQLTVANEIDGELVTRSARSAIDGLDRLEDTLERVRLCALPDRVIE